MRTRVLLAALLLTSAARPGRVHAQQTDVIRGRVTGPDTTSLEGVNVRAVSAAGMVARTTKTDRAGRYQVTYANGEGDYWVELTKIGFAPQRREIKRIGNEEVLVLNVRMVSTIATLDTIKTTAALPPGVRALVNRNGADRDIAGATVLSNADLSSDLMGNLAAMVAGIDGVQIIPGLDGEPDMYSVLGLGGDQNSTTFNGLGSGITLLPPDILATASFQSVSYDPAKGGFSGGQIAISTQPGSNFSRRLISHGNILPALQWTDAAAAAQAQKFTNLRLGGNAAGPMVLDRMFYNLAYNVSRRTSNARTLFNTSALGLGTAGVALDSVERLRGILTGVGVPLSLGTIPRQQQQTAAQMSTNLDFSSSASGNGDSFIFGAVGNLSRSDPIGQSLLAAPVHAGASTRWSGNASLLHLRYIKIFLSKTSVGLATSHGSSAPYLDLPEGSVRVRSMLADSTQTVKSLVFGGSPARSANDAMTVQLRNELSWYSLGNTHMLKVSTEVSRASVSTDDDNGTAGRFVFNSLTDLEAGRAASYARTLLPRRRTAAQVTMGASLGDYWRPTSAIQVQYGVRVDANRFLSAPTFNPSLMAALGVRNDHVPNEVYVSPRMGVQWSYGKSPTIAYTAGAQRRPRAIMHAGVGMFQNVGGPLLISGAVNATGLANAVRSMACVGDATPTPDWNAYLDDPTGIPSQCADGSAGTVFSTAAPNVTLFDPRFRQPRAVRTSADWAGAILDNRFNLGVSGTLSFGRAQPGTVDANLDATTRFTLDNEGDRPVFVDPAGIVATTGAIAPGENRLASDFQRVSIQRSALRTDARMISVTLAPVIPSRYLRWTLGYSFTDVDETYYGFRATTGNPFDIGRGPSMQAGRQTLSIAWRNFPIFDLLRVSTTVRFASGARYTPTIVGDVNGDGVSGNDLPYLSESGSESGGDSAVSAGIASLIANGSRSARECLTRQLGQFAGRASCRGPLVTTMGMIVSFNPAKIGLPKRATVSMSIQNPLALADLALHGSNGTHGWGQVAQPDQSLLFVRGLDPATRRFRYDVNQRFGSTRPQQTLAQRLPYISLNVSVDIGVPRERQRLEASLNAGRSRPGLKAQDRALWQLGVTSIPNPMAMILAQSDSLGLSRTQADSLAQLSHAVAVAGDSLWTLVSRSLAALPVAYNRGEAYSQYVRAREHTMDYLIALAPNVKPILTASQWRKLPIQITAYLDERTLRFLRSSSAGDISAFLR